MYYFENSVIIFKLTLSNNFCFKVTIVRLDIALSEPKKKMKDKGEEIIRVYTRIWRGVPKHKGVAKRISMLFFKKLNGGNVYWLC